MENNNIPNNEEYKYGFHDKDTSVYKTNKGLTRETVLEISRIKQEPDWMREYRLQAFEKFESMEIQDWGPDLSVLDFDDYTYYIKPSDKTEKSWDDVPETIKDTFDKLGIPEAEKEFLAGVTTQYDSEAVYHNMLEEVEEKGVIFLDTDTALKKHPELFKQYFGKLVPYTDNKFAALNSCVWSGGSFIYVPKGVHLDKPLQSYFRINTESMGQFERTLIIVDEGADVHYVEGCTAPIYSKDSLHAAVVEIFVHKNARCRYSTVQNWSDNILNLVTKRAKVLENGSMEWIDGNIGSHINMKYPACILAEPYAKGTCISIAVAGKNQVQDAGAKMIHLAPNTYSNIISKSVSRNGGEVNYRGLVYHSPNAEHAKSKVECDTLILDKQSRSDTIPTNKSKNLTSQIEHEATVSNISEEQLFYLMSRGLTRAQATEMIVMGFLEPFTRELPMEYAVELNQLLKLDMSDSIG
ncbi:MULTISPECIES: Fe-S cluster assembly protein SufB [Bacillota]|uniref:Fe-S cluster assembly protein SufB n=2 Tax=Amedibacillus TaxID=2749846 RepID=A0A7G9GMW1_9FIRM|nr:MULTISPECIES: Fe-S cluster assembly protein SufB [Bacillota]QNM12143.1 Fe-S cluster assembly protein SufB [[Eubacterium] hominis]MCH4287372.1 Fe-S cluster assembly protein SufB [Amedibacillus hominis]RGB49478.1 Fe-S cluster assembly protein SufB [Absiella sp. AM22-9]RGB54975.1 Fe-S cluster assembly protein SufB [Absiella sp. AM10-20]RGB63784.1 Fe-S cluster assembly protein SufB [Absiella sp. AM09-45]